MATTNAELPISSSSSIIDKEENQMSECRENTNSATPVNQFLCIEYPGKVKNMDKALETLGGVDKISEVYSEANRRMEVRFRPKDAFCKPACGERHNSTSLLIKIVRRRKKKKTNADVEVSEDDTTYTSHLEGVIHTVYKFNTLCDFQYLPVINKESNGKMEHIPVQNELIPMGMESSSWLSGDSPLFLPPAAFSRMDTPQDYRYRREHALEGKKKIPQNIICRTRLPRTHYAIFCTYKNPQVPQKPLPGAILQVQYKFLDGSYCAKLQAEFEKRPIWSKNALMVRLGFTGDNLKYLLPTISYYFHTGPWRNLWVKLGHDPRLDPNSWFYQTFDFRIRQAGGVKSKVEAKRSYSNYILPYKSANCSKKKTSVIQSQHFEEITAEGEEADNPSTTNIDRDSIYIFKPGMIPPYRQMFYQYCDIHVPEIQKLLEESVLSGAGQTCTEKNGWLPPGVEARCRDIVSHLVEQTIAERTVIEGTELNVPSEESSTDNPSDEESNL